MQISKDDDVNLFEKATTVIEQNIVGVKLGLYGIGIIGFGIALRSVRPFKKIVTPNDIPQFFIDGNLKLSGKVLGIEFFPRTVLAIDHQPLLGANLRRPARVPVDIEGVTLTGNGVAWLQSLCVGENVDFIVTERNPEFLSCIIFDKKRNIGSYLVSIGFASVAPFKNSLERNEVYTKYYKSLLKNEDFAERKGHGMWWDQPQRFSLLDFIVSKVPVLNLKTVIRRS